MSIITPLVRRFGFLGALNPARIVLRWHSARCAKRCRTLMQADDATLQDDRADEFFTVIDGKPTTFGEFNSQMDAHFRDANDAPLSPAFPALVRRN